MTTMVFLTSVPIRVSTGAKQVHVTINKGSKPYYATGVTSPSKLAFHVLQEPTMNIGEGFSVWMWNSGTNEIEIAYSEAT